MRLLSMRDKDKSILRLILKALTTRVKLHSLYATPLKST